MGCKDVVIDTNVMRLYDRPKDPLFKAFFKWLREKGTLTISNFLRSEYGRSCNGEPFFILINELNRNNRYNNISKIAVESFTSDKNFTYTCNNEDIKIARVVFLSSRKKLVAFDGNLSKDINRFKKVDKIKPRACNKPQPAFYE